ncbi:polysaccharide deacetylase family protein, partial [Vibrio campbellii]
MKLTKLAMVTLLGSALSQFSYAQEAPKGTIYLTFDDGPINASIDVINVLNQQGVKG